MGYWHTTFDHFLEQAETVFALVPLTELSLSYTGLRNADVPLLAASPHLARLRVLHLGSNVLHCQAAIALAESPHVANLTKLVMSGTYIRQDGACALAASPYLQHLRELNLENTFVEGDLLDMLRERFGPGVTAYRADL